MNKFTNSLVAMVMTVTALVTLETVQAQQSRSAERLEQLAPEVGSAGASCAVLGGGIIPHSHAGCVACAAVPGQPPRYSDAVCRDGRVQQIGRCSISQPGQGCPAPPVPVCLVMSEYARHNERFCFLVDESRNLAHYARCESVVGRRPRLDPIAWDISPSDPRCTRLIRPSR